MSQPKWEVQTVEVKNTDTLKTDFISGLLNDGWELFSHVVFQDNSEHLYFKRLLP